MNKYPQEIGEGKGQHTCVWAISLATGMSSVLAYSNKSIFKRLATSFAAFRQISANDQKVWLNFEFEEMSFCQIEVKFVGQIIGSGKRRPDPAKVAAVKDMKAPETKKQVRQVMGLFSYFRDFIPNFAELSKPLTDLTGKRVPNHMPWMMEK